ncbi:DUF2993 domain-containing protein [Streptomyces sp. NPDC047028]|uniref:LmeA family phospholipid-binding protein n=1 Tax=Streptomyces sp. NPDC047028 TaxID=3155793 RepID=UPI0033CEB497
MIRRIPSSRRAGLLAGGTLLCLTATGVLVGNASVEHRVEQRVAAAAHCRMQPSGQVTASLDGTFAGLKALSGQADTVSVHATDVKRHEVALNVDATLHGVHSDGTTKGGTATVTAPYDQLTPYLAEHEGDGSRPLTVGSDGAGLALNTTTGRGLPVTVHTDLKTTGNSLTVTPTDVTVLGRDVPVTQVAAFPGSSGVADELAPKTVKLDDLPDGARVTGAHADADGLVLTVSLPSGGKGGTASGDCPS